MNIQASQSQPNLPPDFDYSAYTRPNQDPQMLATALANLARAECQADNARRSPDGGPEGRRVCAEHNPNLGNAWYAYGLALEASGQAQSARQAIEQALLKHQDPVLGELYALEADRMDGNVERAKKRYKRFVSRGLLGLAQVALRYFPQLAQDSQTAQSNVTRLNVLGSVTLEHSGQTLPTRGKKRLAILSYLLEARLAGRAEVDVLELVDVFYSDMPEDRAKLTLRQLIHLTRTSLGPTSIVSTPTGYALGTVGSDLEAFLESGDSRLWRGGYLQNLSDGWHGSVRDGLLLALRSRVEALLGSDPVEAVRLATIWLEMEPYDLEALRFSIQAFQAQGNHKAAQRAYQQGQQRLSEVSERLPQNLEDFLSARSLQL